jgi:phospholipid/cholesterol/gamma-HCH transport system substrate-binding protein
MNERVMQFRVGVMVIAAAVFAAVLALTFEGLPSFFHKTYSIRVEFPATPGLTVGAPVRKRGVRIGEVSHIELTADDRVLVTLRIGADYQIHHDETCRVKNSLLGDGWLEFEPTQATDSKPVTESGTPSGR